MEVADSKIATDCKVLWRNHPIITSNYKEITYPVHGDLTIRQVLINSGIDTKQPILIVLDDRLLTVEEWDEVCPKVGQIINVHASVLGGGGGGGDSNPMQTIAMVLVIAVAIAAPYMAPASWGMLTAAGGVSMTGAMLTAGVMMAGSMVINSVFTASNNATSLSGVSGTYAEASPTYSLSGGSNRIRPYESMPVVFGTHQLFPDLSSKPYTEYQGEDQYLYQIFNFGLSTLELSKFKIGTTDITDYSDYEWALPVWNGSIPRFPGNVDSISGANLTASSGWITRTTSKDTYKIGIDIEGMLYYANNSGGMDSTSVQIRVQYKPTNSDTWIEPSYITTQGSGFAVGHYETYQEWVESSEEGYYTVNTTDEYGNPYSYEAWGQHDTSHYETRTRFVTGSGNVVIVSGSSQAVKRATLFIDTRSYGEFDVRIIRDTPDSTDARLQNKTSWGTLRSYQMDAFGASGPYIGQSRRGLIIRASSQLNGAISRLSCTATAKARFFNGSSWQFAPTSNPAHWFMDFALGRYASNGKLLYGAGKNESELALGDLVEWANFCDQEGLTFNAVLDGNQTIEDYLNAIAKCGFASVSRSSGKLGVIWDKRNSPPVAAFGMSNILNGSFSISYINENLAEEIVCKYINPENDWNQDEVRKTVPGVINPLRTSTIDLYGCTSRAMAGKFANYFAAQQYYRKRRISWDCDFEGFVCQRGDVVLLSHDLTQWGYSGRIVSRDGNTLKLDKKVPRTQNSDHIMIRRPDGSMSTYSVLGGDGESDELILSTAPEFQADYLDIDHIWFFSPLQTPGKLVKILSVRPTSDSRVSIVATDENPEFYAAWDGTFSSPSNSTLLLNNSPVISNISATESLYRKTVGVISKVTVSFSVKGAFDHANYRYRINDGQWISGTSSATNFNFDANEAGMVDVEITPVGNIVSGSTVTKRFEIFGLSMPPSDVADMKFTKSGDLAYLEFAPCPDIDWAYTEVRIGSSWDNSELVSIAKSNKVAMPILKSGNYKLFAKHIDTSGSKSNLATAKELTISNPNPPSQFSVSISGSDLVAKISEPDLTSYPIAFYTISYDDGAKTATFTGDTFKFSPSITFAGDHTYSITSTDIAGNTSSQAVATLTISNPNPPSQFSVSISGSDLVAKIGDAPETTSWPIRSYTIYYFGSGDATTYQNNFALTNSHKFAPRSDMTIAGTHIFHIVAIDYYGNSSTSTTSPLVVNIPNKPAITPSTIDGTVLLKWTDSLSSFPIDRYEVRRGDEYLSSANVVTGSNARFATFLELISWTYKYWVTAVDIYGNKSNPATSYVAVRQPNDYVLQNSYALNGSGIGAGFAYKDGNLYLPVVDETFEDHFLSNASETPQGLIDAGLDIYCSPTGQTGSYSEVIDFKSIINIATVNFNYSEMQLVGSTDISVKLYARASEADEWNVLPNQYQSEVYKFRYVKVEFNAITTGNKNLSKISNATATIVVRSLTDSGKGTALASDQSGTVVYFNKQFSDCQTPIVQANSTQALIPVVDFLDSPNPTSFSVFFYDIAGNRVTTDFSWTVTGV